VLHRKKLDLEMEGLSGKGMVRVDGDGFRINSRDGPGPPPCELHHVAGHCAVGRFVARDDEHEGRVVISVGVGSRNRERAALARDHFANLGVECRNELAPPEDEVAGAATSRRIEDVAVVECSVEVKFHEIAVVLQSPTPVPCDRYCSRRRL
jgi:hypothetical protein